MIILINSQNDNTYRWCYYSNSDDDNNQLYSKTITMITMLVKMKIMITN